MVDNHELEIDNLKKQLQSAYRKYKNHIYYDNHSAIQRLELAHFEFDNFRNDDSNANFNSNVDSFFHKFAESLLNDFDKVTDEFLKNINVISFPKTFLDSDNNNEFISNFNETCYDVNRIHYFIDLPVEGHILGVLWILRCGYLLDDKLYDHCYGNRLNDTILSNLKENPDELEMTPFLFKPYYKNYQSWRDNGLNSVNSILSNNKNAIMLSLDFKDYYYRSLIDFNDLKEDIKKTKKNIFGNDTLDDFDLKLNNFIECVFNEYSNKFTRKIHNTQVQNENNQDYDDYKKLPMIPLGFLPSLIIANWNLQGFDQVVLEDVHPFYYGRYVDDILIVFESHQKSDSFGRQHLEELNRGCVTNLLF